IADRVVPAFALREGAHTPAGEETWAEEMARDRLRLRLFDDAAPKQVADVRAERVDLLAVAVQRQSEVLALGDPEISVEAALELSSLLLELRRELWVLPDLARKPRGADLGVVCVPLELARRPREARQTVVPVRDRIPRVFPALVLEARLLVAALVRDVAVPHQIRVLLAPLQWGARLVLQFADEPAIAGPALVLVQQDDVQRSYVGGAVGGRRRPLLERRELAVPHLVEDPSGILVAEVVDNRPLPVPERSQGRRCELGCERQSPA